MFNWVDWFRVQLKTSGDGLVWAFYRIDPACRLQLPPNPSYMGTWPPARHIWHVTEYERCLVLPLMCEWLGYPMPDDAEWPDDDEAWSAVSDLTFEGLTSAFHQVRQQQIDLLDQLMHIDWDRPRKTPWGDKPLSMVVTKTYQHTFEHGDTLLRMGLWWSGF